MEGWKETERERGRVERERVRGDEGKRGRKRAERSRAGLGWNGIRDDGSIRQQQQAASQACVSVQVLKTVDTRHSRSHSRKKNRPSCDTQSQE